MQLSIASLNSGSNGNCYYVGNSEEAILVDAGISCREIERRMARLELDIRTVRAIFISHEHTDHIKGLAVLASRHRLPVYITAPTRKQARIKLDSSRVFSFGDSQRVEVGSMAVLPFSKNHDAADPYSFVISNGNLHVGIFTDIGVACDRVVHYFRQCHAVFLESNYDEDMLETGGYPKVLKKRIRGGLGHLSNSQALKLYLEHRPRHLSHLILSHLSKNNNRPELVHSLFAPFAGNVQIVVASRDEESAFFTLEQSNESVQLLPVKPLVPAQLSLW